jgi:hypothetical protein
MGFDVVYNEMHWKNYVLLSIGFRLKIFSCFSLTEEGTAQSEEDSTEEVKFLDLCNFYVRISELVK